MKSLIENYINGNLSIARKQARRHSIPAMEAFMVESYGFSPEKALRVAVWLKTGEGWQAACDAQ